MKVKVTQEHIDKGKPGAPYSCPVALAIRDSIPNIVNAGVGRTTIEMIDQHGNWLCYDAPRSVKKFVIAYDYKKPVEPFNFFMPQPVLHTVIIKKAIP